MVFGTRGRGFESLRRRFLFYIDRDKKTVMDDFRIQLPRERALTSSAEGFFNLKTAIAGKSSETQRKYMEWIRLFYREVIGIELNDISPDLSAVPIEGFIHEVTPAAVEAWLGGYAASGHSKSGLGQARAAIVFLARMLVLAKQASSNLWHDLRLVTLPDHAATGAYGESAGGTGARWLTPDEVRTLIRTAKGHKNAARAKRDVSLIWLMVTLGLRRDEVAGLKWENLIRRGGSWVMRIRGKRNKWRAVDVPKETIIALQPWAEEINHGSTEGLPPGILLRRVWRTGVVSEKGITGNAVWRIVTDSWIATGISGNLAPHDLRRTAGRARMDPAVAARHLRRPPTTRSPSPHRKLWRRRAIPPIPEWHRRRHA